jgi:uncharacterized protein YrzB (UPF0473 family)
METSPTITKLVLAVLKVQAEVKPALKTATNPFFHSKYAELSDHWNAVKDILKENELVVMQPLDTENGNNVLYTILAHSSGEFVKSKMLINPIKTDPQSNGSAITYARRYSLCSILNLMTEDDDGNAGTGLKKESENKPSTTSTQPKPPLKQNTGQETNKKPTANQIKYMEQIEKSHLLKGELTEDRQAFKEEIAEAKRIDTVQSYSKVLSAWFGDKDKNFTDGLRTIWNNEAKKE